MYSYRYFLLFFYFQLKIVQYSTDFGLHNAEAFNLNTEVSLCK